MIEYDSRGLWCLIVAGINYPNLNFNFIEGKTFFPESCFALIQTIGKGVYNQSQDSNAGKSVYHHHEMMINKVTC